MQSKYRDCFNILHKVYVDHTYIGQAIGGGKYDNMAFITKVVYGVIEQNIKLSYIISSLAKKVKDEDVNIILKMGVYALVNLDNTPAHTIVDECVNLVKKVGYSSASGLVNAVLRKVSRGEYRLPQENDREYLSVVYSKPQWLVDRLVSDYGVELATKIITFRDTIPTAIRINIAKCSVEKFCDKLRDLGIKYSLTPLANALYVDYADLKDHQELIGCYAVQGLSSMEVINAVQLNGNEKALDVCSAPGGKAVYLAERLTNGEVTACDIYPHRIALIDNYKHTMGIKNLHTVINDATVLRPEWIEKFDIVLCDVVCSGVGTMNSKPDVLLGLDPHIISDIARVQYEIISTSSRYVREGGQLIYSTCSILKEENEDIVNRFLSEHKDFKLDKVDITLRHLDGVGCTLLPHISGTDGFYIARLVRWTH